jgi:four helix bundle protein
MGSLPHAGHFRELVVYQKASDVTQRIFELTRSFPKEETYALTDQARRASRSIGGQNAEAWGKRRYERHFVTKLTDADSEQLESQHWIMVAAACGYLSQEQENALLGELEEIGRMLNSMMEKAHMFCHESGSTVREDQASYFLTDD